MALGTELGEPDGSALSCELRDPVGVELGLALGDGVGPSVGAVLGEELGVALGDSFDSLDDSDGTILVDGSGLGICVETEGMLLDALGS